MTIKIITWVTNKDFGWNGNNFYFEVQPFDYEGREIRRIEVSGGSKNHYWGHLPDTSQNNNYNSRARVEINLKESEIERVREGGFLVINGNVDIKKWKGPSKLHFKLAQKHKNGSGSGSFGDYRIDLETEVNNKWAGENYLVSKIRGFQVSFKDKDERDELFNRLNENEEYTISDINWDCVALLESTSPKILGLNYNGKYSKPTIESAKEKQVSAEQVAREKAAKGKVYDAIERARKAQEQLFDWGYINKNKENFQEAVRALSELIKIAKNGNKEEKEALEKYPVWEINSGSDFRKSETTIRETAKKQGWKYNLDKPEEIDWGSTNQPSTSDDEEIPGPSSSPGTNDSNDSGNNKKRKNDGDSDSPEAKRLRTEEVKNNVKQGISQKNEEGSQKLSELLSRAKNTNDYEELKGILQDISKYEGEEFYIARQDEVKEARNKLGSLNESKFRNDVVKELQDKLAANGIDESKLSEEERKKINQLKSGEITDVNKISEAVNELSESANKEGTKSRLNELLAKAEALVKGTIKGSADYLKKQAKEVQEGLYSFVYGTNSYEKDAYQSNQEKITSALNKLENRSFCNTNQPDKSGFFRPEVIIPVSLAAVALIGITAAVIIRKRKQIKLKK